MLLFVKMTVSVNPGMFGSDFNDKWEQLKMFLFIFSSNRQKQVPHFTGTKAAN